MQKQKIINYNRIAAAILFIEHNFRTQPSLNEIAAHVNLSPFHFQKLFKSFCGISPKQFLQFTTMQYAKSIMYNSSQNLFSTSIASGYSSPSRMHDAFVTIESMTPGEYKNEGENLKIEYSYNDTIFGTILIASTLKGICYVAFLENKNEAQLLFDTYPKAIFNENKNEQHQKVIHFFEGNNASPFKIPLHIKGTPFQLKVWAALLKIPVAHLKNYGQIALEIDIPKAARAVGTAIGSNPIAFIIPCHRVLQSTGAIGGYMWGTVRKKIIIAKEASTNLESDNLKNNAEFQNNIQY
jgi:AraC family transcriptional regulator, regulatory protein of adaptative response / methylated-DNA-[protein]-cysteine methyltransferase